MLPIPAPTRIPQPRCASSFFKNHTGSAAISIEINDLLRSAPSHRSRSSRPPGVFDLWSLISDHSPLPSVPLHPTSLGATMANGARFLHHPGKQLRSPRCLRIVSGHREPFDDVPGHTPAWPGSQVVPGSIVLRTGFRVCTYKP
jgi:hypothetical protein